MHCMGENAHSMTKLLVFSQLKDLGKVAEAWDRLRKEQRFFFPNFESVAFLLSERHKEFRVLATKDKDQITCLACFVSKLEKKSFTLGERKLFSLPIRKVTLIGSAILGQVDGDIFGQFLDIIQSSFDFELISLGCIPIESALHGAIKTRRSSLFVTSPSRKRAIRWLIRLPDTFDEYLGQFGAKLRQTVRRKIRKLNDLNWKIEVIHRVEQVETFLRDAEAISRRTYQWNVGDRLCNDEQTVELYTRRATSGRLRCYIAYESGRPRAFLPGELLEQTFHYETPGYDPQYAKLSPGLVLLMWAIRDLVEHTNCKVFDFGPGGDDTGYKSKFGNLSVDCEEVELGSWRRPYAVGIMLIQEALNLGKNLADPILKRSKIRQRIKKGIRKYGDS